MIGAAQIAQEISQGIARHISQGVSETIGFHDVLKETGSATPEATTQELTDAIASRLTAAGINVNQDLAIHVSDDGQLRVEGEHVRAAEIESILNSDEQIRMIAQRLAGTEAANGLTIRTDQENIRSSPGGYPNW